MSGVEEAESWDEWEEYKNINHHDSESCTNLHAKTEGTFTWDRSNMLGVKIQLLFVCGLIYLR